MTTALARREVRTTVDARARVVNHVRAATSTTAIGMTGHAAVFNSPTLIGGKQFGFYEQVAPGAFRDAIKRDDVRLLINHDPNRILARNRAGNLRLTEDNRGLATSGDMTPTSYALDLQRSMAAGDVTQMSFAFAVEKDSWDPEYGDGLGLRTILSVVLFDVAIVTYPAYEDTDAGLRGATPKMDALRRRHAARERHMRLARARRIMDGR